MELDPKTAAWLLLGIRVFIAFGGVVVAGSTDGLTFVDWMSAGLAGAAVLEAGLRTAPKDARPADAKTRLGDWRQ